MHFTCTQYLCDAWRKKRATVRTQALCNERPTYIVCFSIRYTIIVYV